MPPLLSRRQALTSGVAAAMAGAIPSHSRAAFVVAPLQLSADRRTIEVAGKPASVFALRRPNGASGLVLDPGQRFTVDLANASGEDTIVHWHGQTPPPDQDGVTDTGYAAPIAPMARQRYDFAARPGTHWMHSHHGLQEQALMAAPLIVRTADDLRMDTQEVTVLLHDFSFRSPAEILAAVTGGAAMSHGAASMPASSPAGHSMAGMTQSGAVTDLNDFEYDAYLANDRTLADPLVVRTERAGRVRIRLINGATSTAFWIEFGALEGTVIAADGNPVQPVRGRRFPLAQGQRLDILVTLPSAGGSFPILAQREGDRQQTGFILATPAARIGKVGDLAATPAMPIDMSLERRLAAIAPLAARPTDLTHRITLNGSMMPYAWSIDDRTWTDRKPLRVANGQRVAVEMINRSAMAHPMHLHGHHFQVVALNGQARAGAMRDTVLVPVNGSVTIAFDADNPGRGLFHCHNLFHMATGMMTELAYADRS